jgi:hypothetical protein
LVPAESNPAQRIHVVINHEILPIELPMQWGYRWQFRNNFKTLPSREDLLFSMRRSQLPHYRHRRRGQQSIVRNESRLIAVPGPPVSNSRSRARESSIRTLLIYPSIEWRSMVECGWKSGTIPVIHLQ